MDQQGFSASSKTERPARWNAVSLLIPLAGFLGGFLLVSIEVTRQNFPARRDLAVGTLYGSSIVGGICVLVAILRKERFWGVTALGFALNAVLFLLALVFTL